jgi:hypothetical protein
MNTQIHIQVVGEIWQPGVGPCAMDYTASTEHWIKPALTRERVRDYLDCYAGDFQRIVDFRAVQGDDEIPWANEENELVYNDAMYGDD